MIRRRWLRRTLIVSLVLCLVFSVAACGGGSSTASQQEIARAERHARKEKAEKEKERKLEREIRTLKKERLAEKRHKREKERQKNSELEETPTPAPTTTVTPTPEPSTPSGTDCGNGVVAGPETSCGFALNVQAEYENFIGSGSGEIEAYSEANEEIYSMYCTAAPHECSGAISATVFFP